MNPENLDRHLAIAIMYIENIRASRDLRKMILSFNKTFIPHIISWSDNYEEVHTYFPKNFKDETHRSMITLLTKICDKSQLVCYIGHVWMPIEKKYFRAIIFENPQLQLHIYMKIKIPNKKLSKLETVGNICVEVL